MGNRAGATIQFACAAVTLAGAWILMFLKVEPFLSWFYTFAWWSYIFLADAIVHLKTGNSLIINRRREFVLLALWSIPFWLVFELINVHIKNWYFVNAAPSLIVRRVAAAVDFATVLPGIFVTLELVEAFGILPRVRVRPVRAGRVFLGLVFTAGVISLVLPLTMPRYFFPLVWGCLTFLLEPLNYKFGGRSLIRDLEEGDIGKFVRLLLAGLICGALWEIWNYWTSVKWIYTVPHFEGSKFFEMPIAGYLGFPPFAVECYVMYSFVTLARGAKTWEKSPPPHPAAGPLGKAGLAFVAASAVAFSLFIFHLVDIHTLGSFYEPMSNLTAVGKDHGEKLRALGLSDPVDFAAAAEGEDASPLAGKLGVEPDAVEKWRDLAKMSLLKGIGITNTNNLAVAGVKNIRELAAREPGELHEKIIAKTQSPFLTHGRAPSLAKIKVWVYAARRRTAGP